jgi:hypothetical protein
MRRLLLALALLFSPGWCPGKEALSFVHMSDPQFGVNTLCGQALFPSELRRRFSVALEPLALADINARFKIRPG